MIEADFDETGGRVTVTPAAPGKRVTFEIARVVVKQRWHYAHSRRDDRLELTYRYVVRCAGSSSLQGFSRHAELHSAARAALSRARRYEQAYAKAAAA